MVYFTTKYKECERDSQGNFCNTKCCRQNQGGFLDFMMVCTKESSCIGNNKKQLIYQATYCQTDSSGNICQQKCCGGNSDVFSFTLCQPEYICNGLNPANINPTNLVKYSAQISQSFNSNLTSDFAIDFYIGIGFLVLLNIGLIFTSIYFFINFKAKNKKLKQQKQANCNQSNVGFQTPKLYRKYQIKIKSNSTKFGS